MALGALLILISSILAFGQSFSEQPQAIEGCSSGTFYRYDEQGSVKETWASSERRKAFEFKPRDGMVRVPKDTPVPLFVYKTVNGKEVELVKGTDWTGDWYLIYQTAKDASVLPEKAERYILPLKDLPAAGESAVDAYTILPDREDFVNGIKDSFKLQSKVRKLTDLTFETKGMEPGFYWVTLQGTAVFDGQTPGQCAKTTPPVLIEISHDNLHVTIYPPETDLVPFRTETTKGTFKFTANPKGGTSPYKYEWQVGPEFGAINKTGRYLESVDGLDGYAGKDLPVNIKVADSAGMTAMNDIPSYLHINTPPTVEIVSPSPVSASSIEEGEPITVVATGKDLDNDSGRAKKVEEKDQTLVYSWKLEGKDHLGNPIDPEILRQVSLTTTDNLPLKTGNTAGELWIGNYEISVAVFDGKNYSDWQKLKLGVVRKLQTYTFGFNLDKLNKNYKEDGKKDKDELDKLDSEIAWLKQNEQRKLIIRVEGYTDQVGTDEYNDCLGCRRARFIRQYLDTHGVKNHQFLLSVSYGESASSIPASETRAERRPDRKVVIRYYRSDGMTNKEILDSSIYGGSPLPGKERIVDCSTSCLKPRAGKKPSGKRPGGKKPAKPGKRK